jgi:hypothetical protein
MNDVNKNLISATRISTSVYLITTFGLMASCKSPTLFIVLALATLGSMT